MANWILEEVAAAIVLALIAAAVGGFLSKWYFGRKNQKILRKLSKRVNELERINRAEQAVTSAPASPIPPVSSASDQSVAQVNSLADDFDNQLEPKMLVRLAKAAKTEFAAQQIIAPYRGKKITVSGTVRDVSSTSDHVTVSLNLSDDLTALLFFENSDENSYFAALEPGMNFTASGQIFSARDTGISLDHCELL